MKLKSKSGQVFNIRKLEKYSVRWDGKSKSKFQFAVKQALRPYWSGHIVFEEFPIPFSRLSLDFLNHSTSIAIEVQGTQHLKFNRFFHNNNRTLYLDQLKRDVNKAKFCEECGIKLVEIYPDDILDEKYLIDNGVICG
jgi:hypothetical protein